ncbi:ATP-dependent helicase/nuclease subunit A [Clostridium polyendosporum]|uniref:ATP-dependent helicase/nuclease subunit A n=1 Tax=Clostridium polyendosporum TaxID=69208 RepID=A0A919RZL1_9CLOT|nr:helicase-exonuclease AddAB subunit AddA [Clostridium polyendosporum]GIM29382.1 ATP-dependent helicase/nuclease subunit A [Clostridium polyendosporum]
MGNTKWTKEQLSAINTRGSNLLIAAAAGSGKTAVLVERIIRIITDEKKPIDIDKLLVVTFTSAAASEMRERIGDAIAKALEKIPNSKILQRQLTLLSRSNITTMHSFCLDVIKNNFHHIDLDPNFRIGDATECTLIKSEVVAELFEDRYDSEDNTFRNLVDAYGQGKDDLRLQQLVLDLYDFSMSGPWPEKWFLEKVEELKISSVEELSNSIWAKVLLDSLDVELQGLEKLLYSARTVCENVGGLKPYIINFDDDILQVEKFRDSLEQGLSVVYNMMSTISFSKLKTVRKNQVEDEEAQKKVKDIRDDVKKKIGKLKDDVFAIPPVEAVKDFEKIYSLIKTLTELVIEFGERYKEKKKDRGILDFNDLEHLCLKILTYQDEEGNIIPSKVAEGFREKFEEILVDEYQDTNNIQEAIIGMVSRKSLDNPNVFMVGDVKQSIYRFRHAKPELFLEKYNTYFKEEGKQNRKIMLYKNFRSRREVIEGVNYIFKALMSETVGELQYDEKEALNLGADYKELTDENVYSSIDISIENIKVAGDIELHILNKAGEEEHDEAVQIEENQQDEENQVSQRSDEEEDLDAVQIEARIVAKRIKELVNPEDGSSFMVWDKTIERYREIKYKDIVILLRATKNWSEVFVEELGQSRVPVYADTGTGYFETIEIRTIMSLLHIVDNPMQDIHILAVLRSPIFSFTGEELSNLRIVDKDKYFYETIIEIAQGTIIKGINEELRDKCSYFLEALNKWREKSLYMPIDEFIWYLFMDTSYYGYTAAMPNGVQRQANLRILFQRAKQFEQTSFKGVFNFINFINKLKKSSGDMGSAKILGENEDVVRIMSIHKSKGLEFPVVFLSGCGKQFNLRDLNNVVLFHDELGFGPDFVDVDRRISYTSFPKHAIKKRFNLEALSEEMRVLYVALTRAKEKLIITGATADIERASRRWCSAASLDDKIIPPSEVLKGRSYLDWIGIALSKHRDGEPLRELGGGDIKILKDELSTWKIKVWTKSDLIVDKEAENVDECEEKRKSFVHNEQVSIREAILKRLDFKYTYERSTILPANISVSDLKRTAYNEGEGETLHIYKVDTLKKPLFLQEEKGLSPAERGTVIHFVMQHLNLDFVDNIKAIEDQITNMIHNDLLTEDQVKVIRPNKIFKFFKSNIGKRMLKCHKEKGTVYRELPFFTTIPASMIEKDLPTEVYDEEVIRLQGVIDCFFEEEDGIVLLDYKTDYVERGEENKIKDRYEVQMRYYADTLEKITGKRVKEEYLYLFYLDSEVKY